MVPACLTEATKSSFRERSYRRSMTTSAAITAASELFLVLVPSWPSLSYEIVLANSASPSACSRRSRRLAIVSLFSLLITACGQSFVGCPMDQPFAFALFSFGIFFQFAFGGFRLIPRTLHVLVMEPLHQPLSFRDIICCAM